MSTTILKRVATYLVYLSLLTPLIAFPRHFIFPFVVPKVVFFRSLVILLMALTAVIYWYSRKVAIEFGKKRVFWTPLAVGLILFFASLIVSTFVGVDWYLSFWDNHERMLGTFTVLHYGIFFFLCRYLFDSWTEWRRVFGVLLGVGIVTVFIGVIQKMAPDFFYNSGAGRVISTLGNPIYLGGLGLFMLFTGLLFFFREKLWWRWYFLAGAFFGLVGVVISGTRGSFMGVLAGGLVAGMLYLILAKDNKKVRMIIGASLLGLVVLGGLAFVFRSTSFIANIPLVGPAVNISTSEGTAKTRLMAWGVALEGFRNKPIFGWGPNNYYYVFNQFYNPDFLKFGFAETWFDNAHGVVFNTLATQGVVGLIFHLGLYGCAVFCLYRVYHNDHNQLRWIVFGVGFLVGHFVHNFFVFENITSYLYFFLFLAFVDSAGRLSEKNVEDNKNITRVSWGMLAIPVVIALIAILYSDINVALANSNAYYMRGYLLTERADTALVRYRQAQKWHSPYGTEIDWDFASGILDDLPRLFTKNATTSRQFYDLADQGMKNFVNRHPLDVRAYLGYTDLLRGGVALFDLPAQDEVNKLFAKARALSPRRQQVDYSEVSFMAGTGEVKEVIEQAKKLVEAYPYSAEGYYHWARFLFHDMQLLEILPVLDKAINNGVRFTDPTHLEFVAMAYEREGRFRDSLYWWDQMYKITGSASVKNKRDNLSELTQLPIPKKMEDFFKFATSSVK